MSRLSTIAIDGPVASGKSTIGRLLAMILGYRFVDTGTMYRALTWKALQLGIDLHDENKLRYLAEMTSFEFVAPERLLVDGQEVTSAVRTPEVERGVSLVARVAGVREVLVKQQRTLARDGSIIMAGRDIGTTVLPYAELKLYLDASLEERARRRYSELVELDQAPLYDTVLADLRRRDEIDSARAVSPLQPATDAKLVDTNGLTVEQVLTEILQLVSSANDPVLLL